MRKICGNLVSVKKRAWKHIRLYFSKIQESGIRISSIFVVFEQPGCFFSFRGERIREFEIRDYFSCKLINQIFNNVSDSNDEQIGGKSGGKISQEEDRKVDGQIEKRHQQGNCRREQ